MVFCYQNCSDLLGEKIVLAIKKNFWNSRLKAENLQKILRSFIQKVKGQKKFWYKSAFLTCSWRFLRYKYIRTIIIQIGKKYWDLESCRKSYKNLKSTTSTPRYFLSCFSILICQYSVGMKYFCFEGMAKSQA